MTKRAHVAMAMAVGALGCSGSSADHGGTIFLTQIAGSGTVSYSATAEFADVPLDVLVSGDIPGCTVMTDGACRMVRCSGASGLTLLGAGTVSVSVGSAQLASIPMPSAAPFYMTNGTFALFAHGDAVQFAATGGAVPAFSVSVTAPAAPVVTLPTTIALTSDLVVTWDHSIAAEELRVSIIAVRSPGAGEVSCAASAGEGSLTVPAAMIGNLGAGDVTIGIVADNHSTIRAGAYDVQAQVGQGITGAGRIE